MFDFIIGALDEYWRAFLGIFIFQGILGVLMFEWAWKKTERVRKGEEACWVEFPSFRRTDTHMWNRSVFYPGCFLFLCTRLVIILGFTLWIGVV